jgi:alkanesulfonate monooxygenase SsuD/methylene tetrahydromethanopterin reductase-like flavin-dependent oxidoreductase (luciferase family)
MMRIGMFMTPQWQPGADLGAGYRNLLEQARAARQNGFSSVLVGQHMVTGPDMQMFQVMPLMARLLPEIEGMQVGPGVMLLPMLSPVLVAEESATLDWMSNGNFVLAVGLGYREEEFEAMGTRRAHRVPRLEESIEVVKRLWTEERVTHHGRHFHLSDVGASVRPKQQPHPPIWLGGDVERAIRRAGRLADAWLGTPTTTVQRLRQQLGWFTDARREAGRMEPVRCPILRECFVGRDAEHARRVSRGPLLYKYQAYASWGHNDLAGTDLSADFDAFCSDRFVLGDVSQARDEIIGYGETLDTDHLIVRVQWPGLDQAEALGNIERLGQVIAGLS